MTFSILIKIVEVLLSLFMKNVLKMHGHKSKFIMKVVQVQKQEEFSKRENNIFEIKEDGRRRRNYPKA